MLVARPTVELAERSVIPSRFQAFLMQYHLSLWGMEGRCWGDLVGVRWGVRLCLKAVIEMSQRACWTPRVHFHFEPAPPLHGSYIIISNLQMIFNFLRPSTVKWFAQSHKTCKTWNWSLNPGVVSLCDTYFTAHLLTGMAHRMDASHSVLPVYSCHDEVSHLIISSRLSGRYPC